MSDLEDQANHLLTNPPVPDGSAAEPEANHPPNGPPAGGRLKNGQFGPGHILSRKHSLYVRSVSPAILARTNAFYDASLADDGGPADLGIRRQSEHAYRARLDSHIQQLSDAIHEQGLFDKRNRLRIAWIRALESLISRATAIDQTLGLERRAKPVPTLDQVLDGDK